MQELQRAAAEQAVGRVTEQLGERGVHRRERLLEIEHCEPERRPLEALPVPLLGLDPFRLRLAPVGDVTDVGDPSADRGRVVHVGQHLFGPAVRAVGDPEPPLDRRGAGARHRLAHRLPVALDVVGVDEVASGTPDDLVRPVAEPSTAGLA